MWTIQSPDSSHWAEGSQPAAPNAKNWEGASGVLSGWTEWDFGGRLNAPTYANGHAVLNYQAGATGTNWAGMYKTVPAGSEYVIFGSSMLVSEAPPASQYVRGGLILFQDATDIAADIAVIFRRQVSDNEQVDRIRSVTRTAYNGVETIRGRNWALNGTLFRYRVNGSNIIAGASNNGIGWEDFASFNPGWTPLHMGFALWSETTAFTMKVRYFSLFRRRRHVRARRSHSWRRVRDASHSVSMKKERYFYGYRA